MKIFIGLVILVLIGTVSFAVFGKNFIKQPNSPNQNQNQNTNQVNDTVNPNGQYSINELLTMNKPMKCTWKESTTEEKNVTNIIYINNKKFYQDVTMSDVGHSYTISDGENLYMWNDFSNMASKMKYSDIKISPPPGQTNPQGDAAVEQKKDFICEKWSVDNNVFIPPKDKNFKDVTNDMNDAFKASGNNNLESAKQRMCDLCKNAPDQETIDECLKNAQCDQ